MILFYKIFSFKSDHGFDNFIKVCIKTSYTIFYHILLDFNDSLQRICDIKAKVNFRLSKAQVSIEFDLIILFLPEKCWRILKVFIKLYRNLVT